MNAPRPQLFGMLAGLFLPAGLDKTITAVVTATFVLE